MAMFRCEVRPWLGIATLGVAITSAASEASCGGRSALDRVVDAGAQDAMRDGGADAREEAGPACPSGALDRSFGQDGATSPLFLPAGSHAPSRWGEGLALAVDPSTGMITIAGPAGGDGYGFFGSLVRLHPNGLPDSSFGTSGKTSVKNMIALGGWYSVLLQPDGKILVATTTLESNDSTYPCAIARYLPDGQPDADFGADGVVRYGMTSPCFPHAFALDGEGRSLVAIHSYTGGGFLLFALRVLPDGTLDTTFGAGGIAMVGPFMTTIDSGAGLAISSQGPVLTTAQENTYSVWHLTPSGAPAPERDYTVRLDHPVAASIILDDGVSYVATQAPEEGGAQWLQRILPNGVSSGLSAPAKVPVLPSGARIARDAGGRIVLAGNTASGIAFVRYSPDGQPDTTFGTSGVSILSPEIGGRLFTMTAIAAAPDGSIVASGVCGQPNTWDIPDDGDMCAVKLCP